MIKNGLVLRKFAPSGINLDGEIYAALFSDANGKGAIANELDDVTEYINEFILNDDIDKMTGTNLDTIIMFFSGQERLFEESDENYLMRFKSLTARFSDTVWGTKWNILHVFEGLFAKNGTTIYIVENTNDWAKDNLLTNYEFEESIGWSLAGCSYERVARFSKSRGVLFSSGSGTCKQILSALSGTYVFHCFIKGEVSLLVKDKATSEYWNEKSETWTSDVSSKTAICNDWDVLTLFVTTDKERDLEFTIQGTAGSVADFSAVFKKQNYCSYTVAVQFTGEVTGEVIGKVIGKVVHAAGGGNDPSPEVSNYDNASYYEHDFYEGFMSGSSKQRYEDLLQILNPCGIKPYLMFIDRNF